MNKPIVILLLILMVVSCKKSTDLPINESQFQNKTFSLLFESEEDTLIIEFQDTTYQTFGSLWEGKIPWRISHFENSDFLVLDNRVIGIKKMDENQFDCIYIGVKDNPFTMVERKVKWNKELLYGTWVKKEYSILFDYSRNNTIQKPPVPAAPEGFSESDYKLPAYYIISKDSIKFFEAYSINKSKIEINTTSEYLTMDLENKRILGKEWEWNIRKLDSEFMIVTKRVSELYATKYVTDTLIRKKP